MFNDYKITSSYTSIKGKKVRIIDSNKIGCVVIEHIFENACLVRWPLLRNKTGQGIEFIKNLEIIKEIKKEEKMGKIRLEEFDDEEFEDIEFEKFSKTKKTKMKKRTKENKVKFDKPTNIIKLKKKNGKKEKKRLI